jgi:3-deoxy-D-manno-octulosonic-acid transferase
MERIVHRSPVLSTLAYRAAVSMAVPLAALWLRRPATQRGHEGRLRAAGELLAWATEHRDRSRPLAWFHAASVGEGLQARAVLRALRGLRPDLQVIVTRFSASADRLGDSPDADFTGYLPYDRRGELSRVLEALDPALLVFAKVDVWPELTTLTAARGTRVALVAATVDPGSARLGRLGRWVAERGYRVLDLAAAVSAADADRLARLGTPRDRIVVTGDPRVDVVLEAVSRAAPATPDARLLVAGSTWPEDEAVLLDAFVRVRERHPDARLIVAPHEPTPPHLDALEAAIRHRGLTATRWAPGAAESDVQVVETMGVLAGLYATGAMAYVGGGFGARGIHSVLEPAGWARPVVIGPNDRGVRDAALLEAAGGLVRLPPTESAVPFATQWNRWLETPLAAADDGARARAALESDRGAAGRSADLLVGLLDASSGRHRTARGGQRPSDIATPRERMPGLPSTKRRS